MKKIAYIIIPWAISLLFRGCAHDADSEMFDREVPLVNLDVYNRQLQPIIGGLTAFSLPD